MTLQDAYKQLQFQLFEIYDDREATIIADWTIEHITGFSKIDRLMHKQFVLSGEQESLFLLQTKALLAHTPVQYVLGKTWFAGMPFMVNENVLIPRPETEELVDWIVQSNTTPVKKAILDIGTGSGCIPITLKKKMSFALVEAMDISANAIAIAQQNATALGADVHFYTLDIFDKQATSELGIYDIIVSNPPYIKQSEATDMLANVLQYEPAIALFVPDEDALVFYKAIAVFAKSHLGQNGQLFFEINEALGAAVCTLLEEHGFTAVELRKDLQGKDRMVKAVLANVIQ